MSLTSRGWERFFPKDRLRQSQALVTDIFGLRGDTLAILVGVPSVRGRSRLLLALLKGIQRGKE